MKCTYLGIVSPDSFICRAGVQSVSKYLKYSEIVTINLISQLHQCSRSALLSQVASKNRTAWR